MQVTARAWVTAPPRLAVSSLPQKGPNNLPEAATQRTVLRNAGGQGEVPCHDPNLQPYRIAGSSHRPGAVVSASRTPAHRRARAPRSRARSVCGWRLRRARTRAARLRAAGAPRCTPRQRSLCSVRRMGRLHAGRSAFACCSTCRSASPFSRVYPRQSPTPCLHRCMHASIYGHPMGTNGMVAEAAGQG